MTLGEKQRLFMKLLGKLIEWAYANGYELTEGDAFRSDEQAAINAIGFDGRNKVAIMIQQDFPQLAASLQNNGRAFGILYSVHQDRLAMDVNLFRDGVYLSDTESHKPLGEYWESLHPLARWGGKFKDGNHYSVEHEGRK